jgi:hypothetical protein
MSGTIRRIAGFEGDAAGHRIALRTAATVGCFVMLQAADGSAACYVGFSEDGMLTVNCQRDGAWQDEQRISLPTRQEGPVDLALGIMRDHVIIHVNGAPWMVAALGSPAAAVTAALMRGIGEVAVPGGQRVHSAGWDQLSAGWPPRLTSERGVVLLSTRWLSAAVPDALTLGLPVVVAAPLPWQLAELAMRFDEALSAGRLLPLRGMPAAAYGEQAVPGSEDDPATVCGVDAAAWSAACGPIRRLYADAAVSGRLAVPAELVEAAESVVEIRPLREAGELAAEPQRRGYLRRPDADACMLAQPWLSVEMIRRLAGSSLSGDVLVFTARETTPAGGS